MNKITVIITILILALFGFIIWRAIQTSYPPQSSQIVTIPNPQPIPAQIPPPQIPPIIQGKG